MHLGNFSLGCAGLVMTEVTDVNPQGRISPRCAGMWSDENEKALKRVHDFCRQYGVANWSCHGVKRHIFHLFSDD
jgi:2,4-dienoyl-CoA reductase-like NADH-dependent reductase (Old Yellow Enzyme family)